MATKKKAAKRSRASKPKAKNFTFKGQSGALARRKAGIHLLIVRIPVAIVKRIDRKIKDGDRQPWLADVITRAAKR